MPVYICHCQNCGAQFEKTQKFNDLPLTRCPECRKGKVTRLLQAPNIIFKGAGWYTTDRRSAAGHSHQMSGSTLDTRFETRTSTKGHYEH